MVHANANHQLAATARYRPNAIHHLGSKNWTMIDPGTVDDEFGVTRAMSARCH